MANGYKISADRGQGKEQFTVADAAPGSAGIEILVDHTKFLNRQEIAIVLLRAAELITERDNPLA